MPHVAAPSGRLPVDPPMLASVLPQPRRPGSSASSYPHTIMYDRRSSIIGGQGEARPGVRVRRNKIADSSGKQMLTDSHWGALNVSPPRLSPSSSRQWRVVQNSCTYLSSAGLLPTGPRAGLLRRPVLGPPLTPSRLRLWTSKTRHAVELVCVDETSRAAGLTLLCSAKGADDEHVAGSILSLRSIILYHLSRSSAQTSSFSSDAMTVASAPSLTSPLMPVCTQPLLGRKVSDASSRCPPGAAGHPPPPHGSLVRTQQRPQIIEKYSHTREASIRVLI